MSYLTPPRLTFFGNSYANASTANNNDLAGVYDIDAMKLYPTMMTYPTSTVTAPLPVQNPFPWTDAKSSNPDLRNWLMGLMQIPVVPHGFNEDDPGGLIAHGQMAHWNYYGDHNTEFQQTFINAATLASGQPTAATDPALKLQVEILGDVFYGQRRGGVMVDADPYGLITTQIFSGQFRLSLPNGSGKYPVVIADHPTPAYSYFINPNKNLYPYCEGFQGVSAVFQFGLKKENLSFDPLIVAQSPALADLQAQVALGQGLMVRFCFYDAVFNIQATDLNTSFNNNQYVFNPYLGKVLGTIGVWNTGELASAPVGRMLRMQTPYLYTPPTSKKTAAELAINRHRMGSASRYQPRRKAVAGGDPPPTARLGITLAAVNTASHMVSLDCISTFPESTPGEQNVPNSRPKYKLGPVNLVLVYLDDLGLPHTEVIGNVPYDEATYETGGGIVDVSYAGSANQAIIDQNIGTGHLALQGPNFTFPPMTGPYPLVETPTFTVQTDNRVVYFNAKVGSGAMGNVASGTSQITIQVQSKGVAPMTPTTVNIEYWMVQKMTQDGSGNPIPLVNPDKPQAPVPLDNPYYSVTCAGGVTRQAPTPYFLGFLIGPDYPDGNVTVLTDQVTVPAGGQLTLNLSALRPGVSLIRFTDPNNKVSPNFAWDNVDFAIVRILPFDDYSGVSDETINSWDYIYAEVFGFYSVLYPLMSKVIPWGPDGAPNNPTDVKQFASQLLAFTDPSMWNTTIYMPITRDMSGGKRELLRRWCNLQQ